MTSSGIFTGTLRHRRFTPVAHEFVYPLFMVLLNIDRIPDLMRVSTFTSVNRWNWASFHDGDHLGQAGLPLRERLVADAAKSGVSVPDGPIFLLTHLRYLGYCFNPVSFYYVFDRGGRIATVLAEVRNTFGGAHNYWLRPDGSGRTFRASAGKSLYVSPFLPVDVDYTFALTPPEDRLVIHMKTLNAGETILDATLLLERRPWTAAELRRQLVRHPAMTASVIAGIHWQALTLWWKGAPPVPMLTPHGEGERDAARARESRTC